MRLANVFSGRPAFYDRNPSQKVFSGTSQGIGPHTNTVRYTYTVPTARKAYIGHIYASMSRTAVATTPQVCTAFGLITPFGGSVTDWYRTHFEGNVADTVRTVQLGAGDILYAGDVVQALDSDASTGGTTDCDAMLQLTEFDA